MIQVAALKNRVHLNKCDREISNNIRGKLWEAFVVRLGQSLSSAFLSDGQSQQITISE